MNPNPQPIEIHVTVAKLRDIRENMLVGISLIDAVQIAGIKWHTFKKWLTHAKAAWLGRTNGSPIELEYYPLLRCAQNEGKAKLIKTISMHALKDFKAAQYLLERMENRRSGAAQLETGGNSQSKELSAAERMAVVRSFKEASQQSEMKQAA